MNAAEKDEAYTSIKSHIQAGGFAVSLSGGGHRATLATLGALLAIVDRGLAPKVLQVASVSGGSITNAFVASRCRFEKLEPGGLDDIATQLATTVILKGVLTRRWISVVAAVAVTLGVVASLLLRLLIAPWTWLSALVGMGVALSAMMLRGHLIDWLLNRRYFAKSASKVSEPRQDSEVDSLSRGEVDHVLCMTDLVLGLPVYASTQQGGTIWRRLSGEKYTGSEFDRGLPAYAFQTFQAERISISSLVRASAAFPGIAPLRLRIPTDTAISLAQELPRIAFLADGGLWNNLGTQVLREDRLLGTLIAPASDGVLRPHGPAPDGIPILCFNGSAPLRPSRPWLFHIPGVALLKSLLQVTKILSANTVLPRVDAMGRAFRRRANDGLRPDGLDPADLVSDLRPTDDVADEYTFGTWDVEAIRQSDRSVKLWAEELISRYHVVADGPRSDRFTPGALAFLLGSEPPPSGTYPVCGLANGDDWDILRYSAPWRELVEMYGVGNVHTPTTLGRVNPDKASRLVARGYLNTYLVSLFLSPLADDEVERLRTMPRRIDAIVGRHGT